MKFDLHIHSKESEYKEVKGIVENSTVENVDVLLKKLNDNEVGLFSITDHNRFNVPLYEKLDEKIQSGVYENVKGLVAGIEFDVKIDNSMEKCHIITIFNSKNKVENYNKIQDVLNKQKLKNKADFYEKDEFEKILREIGLDVILIACQRSGLDLHEGGHNSLSESTIDPENLIQVGYISALEFQKPNVEGILKNNLKNIPQNIGLIMGSDCHDWEAYPYHDKKSPKLAFSHSDARILPTFKGLLMAVSSPETRINQQKSMNTSFIDKFTLGNKEVHLVNGINVIIGENGAGKSTLLNGLCNRENAQKYMKDCLSKSEFNCENKFSNTTLLINQGDIVSKFSDNSLFPKNQFKEIDMDDFKNSYQNYAKKILEYIEINISAEAAKKKLDEKELEYIELDALSTYFLRTDIDDNFTQIKNIHYGPKKNLEEILNKLKSLLGDGYFQKYESKIHEIIRELELLFKDVKDNYDLFEKEISIKNIISSKIKEYDRTISELSTTKDKEVKDYYQRKRNFVDCIVTAIKKNTELNIFPNKPNIFKNGFSINKTNGFSFNLEAEYNKKDLHDDFLSSMFIREYANIDSLKNIKNEDTLIYAIRNCTIKEDRDSKYNTNLNKFISDKCKYRNYIVDESNGQTTLGNTLGEQSLAYLKYITECQVEKNIFFIDQPEDHISNNNISNKLINYLNAIRNKKQIVIVTHNPLLVVNLDAEQVIFVRKNNNKIDVVDGCLEYEDNEINILSLIANNMDGGKESIAKRLRIYG